MALPQMKREIIGSTKADLLVGFRKDRGQADAINKGFARATGISLPGSTQMIIIYKAQSARR